MSPRKLLLTLVVTCKLCFAAAPLVLLLQPIGELFQTHAEAQLASPAAPQPGGLRRLFGRRLLGQ